MKLRHSILALLLFTQWSMVNNQWSMIRAQENDEVGIWSEIGVEKSITKKWNVGLDLEYRAQNRSRFSAGLSTSYKPWKWLKFGIGYNYLHSYRPDKYKEKSTKEEDPDNYSIGYNLTPEYWFPRHRFSVEATGSFKLWGWLKVSLRERYQLTYCKERNVAKYKYRQDYTTQMDLVYPPGNPDDPWDPINWADPTPVYTYDVPDGEPTGTWETEVKPSSTDQVLRSRLKLEFDKKRNPFSPFISAELHNSVKPGDKMLLQKIRTAAGLSYKFRKHHEVTFAYLLTFDIHDVEEDIVVSVHNRMHAINFGYNYSF